MDFPPPDWTAHKNRLHAMTRGTVLIVSGAYISSFLLNACFSTSPSQLFNFNARVSISYLIRASITLAVPTLIAYVALYYMQRSAMVDYENHFWDTERRRGLKAGLDRDGDGRVEAHERTKESAEWANNLLAEVVPIINPDMQVDLCIPVLYVLNLSIRFSSLVDMIEDVMQSSVPAFVHSVRVSDMSQGSNPFRITSLRSLPDVDVDEVLKGLDSQDRERLEASHVVGRLLSYVNTTNMLLVSVQNLEISFVYRAKPSGGTARSKAHNAQ